MQIHDNHFHCQPAGWKGLDAVRMFQRAGGTSIAHVRLPRYSPDVQAFQQSVEDHLSFGQTIVHEMGIRLASAIGPYPLEPMQIAKVQGWEAAEAYARDCLDACRPYFQDQRAHCLGEVGRPHFDVDDEAWEVSNRILQYAFVVAKEEGVPIMLHTEHAEPAQMLEFATMADQAHLPRNQVIKHYCGPLVKAEEHHGLVPSIIAGRSNIREALKKEGRGFMLETDYIDEPTRPNVVMPPDTVPKRVMGLHANGELSEDHVHEMGWEVPARLYPTVFEG